MKKYIYRKIQKWIEPICEYFGYYHNIWVFESKDSFGVSSLNKYHDQHRNIIFMKDGKIHFVNRKKGVSLFEEYEKFLEK